MADPVSRSPAFVAAFQDCGSEDGQTGLPAPPSDTFGSFGEHIISGYPGDAKFQDNSFIEKHGLAREGDF